MGFPVCIEDPKYGRNALIFNAGVVLPLQTLDDEASGDTEPDFGPVVIKLATILRTLEVLRPRLSDVQRSPDAVCRAVRVGDAVERCEERPAGAHTVRDPRRHQPRRAMRCRCG